ncbi:COMM domain-containing protein 9 [Tupaia chinensis]|uniref:COMM domain-containing protein 9 n=1 Tax=Tupaia chinensis TaxID=246437 RepID=L8YGZ7_TUPCH|nr:COMM domain-containing protein 9 [Tupaia chinensis]
MAPSSERLLAVTCSGLSVTREEAAQVLQALHHLTRLVVFRGLSSAEAVLALFPENFHQNLKNLLTKIILEHMDSLKIDSVICGVAIRATCHGIKARVFSCAVPPVSLPRLVDLDWRVDIKASSDSVGRMAVPTCLLQVKIQEDPRLCGDKPSVSAVTMELSKETLDTMLDGLGRIRDQLSAVASK